MHWLLRRNRISKASQPRSTSWFLWQLYCRANVWADAVEKGADCPNARGWPTFGDITIPPRSRGGIDRSRRIRGPHAPRDFRAPLLLNNRNVVLALQIEPELCAVAEIAAEAHRRIG